MTCMDDGKLIISNQSAFHSRSIGFFTLMFVILASTLYSIGSILFIFFVLESRQPFIATCSREFH